jgi:ADP-ribosylglycohydrolase
MGIVLEFYTLIVRRDAIDLKYPGGFPAFIRDFGYGTFRADRYLAAVSHMGPHGIEGDLAFLAARGFNIRDDRAWLDVVVMNHFGGLLNPGVCDWIESDRSGVHLAGYPREGAQFYLRRPLVNRDPSQKEEENNFWAFPAAWKDRHAGVLIGLAAGDRNGGPRSIALELCRSLIEFDGLYLANVKKRYLAWWLKDGRDAGPVFGDVMGAVDEGLSWEDAALSVDARYSGLTGGCNPAHRAAPLSMARIITSELVYEARREAAISHRAEIAGTVSAFVVVLCRLLLDGSPWDKAISGAAHWTNEPQLATAPNSIDELSTGGYSPNVLAAALHFLERYDTFEAALDHALDFAGSANYCPVLVGSIGGARWGASAIPARHLQHLGSLSEILDVISLFKTGSYPAA